jgi:hypothetical protein
MEADAKGNPRELLVPDPADPMRIWPISTRVNKPEKDMRWTPVPRNEASLL